MTRSDLDQLEIRPPQGYVARPATLDDVEAATELANAYNIALTGRPTIEAGEIRSEWEGPAMSLPENTIAVFAPDGAMAGLAEVWDSEPHVSYFVYAEVHPAHQGRGIGSLLATWAEARGRQLLARAPEDARIILKQFRMTDDRAAARHLLDQGYVLVRHNLRMSIDFDGPPALPTLPDGLIIRPFVRGKEERAMLLAIREEFRDHWGWVEQPLEEDYRDWVHYLETNPTCDPSLFLVVVEGEEIVGTSVCQTSWPEDPDAGWIHSLGVRRQWRRRGIALALLQQSFVELHRRGKRSAKLGVDAESLTGATRLYEKAGMHMERQFAFYEKELRPGRDLSTRALA